jgi:hypothetical protein
VDTANSRWKQIRTDKVRAGVRQAADIDDAARWLRGWFAENLMLDPGLTGPLSTLAGDMLRTALENFVDWETIVTRIREPQLESDEAGDVTEP